MTPDDYWFKIGGAHGLRFLKEQLEGLDAVRAGCSRASVLDLGCAEGLIGKYLIDTCGADLVHGVELHPLRVEEANKQLAGYSNVKMIEGDLNEPEKISSDLGAEPGVYDVVLLLAILHKLRDPAAALLWAAQRCKKLMAIRLPTAERVFATRHDKKIIDVAKILGANWHLLDEKPGPRRELTLTFELRP